MEDKEKKYKKRKNYNPVFILFLDIRGISQEKANEYANNMYHYLLEYPISKTYYIIIIPVHSETKVQIFYPYGTGEKNYDDLIKELAKLTAKKNIRIKLDK